MKRILTTILLMVTLTCQASPIMQNGKALRPQTCNPSTSCYVRSLLKTRNIAFIQAANGVLLGNVYSQVPDGCWLAYSNAQILYRMKAHLNYHHTLNEVQLYALGYAPFACQ
jgi:hypothetical protein